MDAGIFYGVGTGPGDPELLTIKAVRIIEENDVIAFPAKAPEESTAFRTAAGAVPGIYKKELLPLYMPMSRDRKAMERSHIEASGKVGEILLTGRNVVFLTLGDPMIYSTFGYLKRLIEDMGFEAQTVSGIPSFCAAAALAGEPLAMGDEPIHIIPVSSDTKIRADESGTYVYMKTAKRTGIVRDALKDSGADLFAAVNCGMEGEMIYKGADEIPDEAGYFAIVTARKSDEPCA